MCINEKFQNKYFAGIDFILIFLIGILHFVSFFFIKETDFENLFDTFESSPLFNFNVSENCGKYSHLVFHTWEGVKRAAYSSGHARSRTKVFYRTEIDRINGHYFCYEHKSYKELLYNGQIIKDNEQCPENYPQNCGIIDTLAQHLCIKNEENCPLYDVGIIGTDEPINKEHYIYNNKADIYYNDYKYKNVDKKIIGKIILNDGQPCYRLNEKLWKKFSSIEAGEGSLKCELEIFGETTDNKYKKKGDISYNKLYEILKPEVKEIFEGKIGNDENVSLYIREFLGIDKTCDEKIDIKREDYKKLRKNQKTEGIIILVEAIIIFSFWPALFLFISIAWCKAKSLFEEGIIYNILFVFLIICLLINLAFAICQSVFLGRIIKYDLAYHCSDEITNEVLRKENLNTKTSIKFTAINLGFDIFYILFNICAFLMAFVIEKIDALKKNNYSIQNSSANNNNNKDNKAQNKFKVDEFINKPIREVIVNNETPNKINQYDKPINNNNINQKNANNIPNSYPVVDLGNPPSVEKGYSSNANLYGN